MEKLFRISIAIFAAIVAASGEDYDSNCVASCQRAFGEKSSAFQPAEGSGVPPSDVNSYQEQTCKAYGEMKKCMLSCDGGSLAWSMFAAPQANSPSTNSSMDESDTGILDFCGLGEGIHDENSEIYQDQLCAQTCQSDFQNNLIKRFNPELNGADSQSDSQSGGIANGTEAADLYLELCKADNELKACMFGCRGGEQLWIKYKATASGAAFSCRNTSESVIENTVFSGNESDAKLSDYLLVYQRDACQGFADLKSCFLSCKDGDVLWTNFVNRNNFEDNLNVGDSGSDGIWNIWGLGQGKGDKNSPDFDHQLCLQECHLKILEGYTDESDMDMEQFCEEAAKIETCINLCNGGPAM